MLDAERHGQLCVWGGGVLTALASQGGQQQKDAAREEAPLIPSDLLSVLPIQDAGAPVADASASDF